MRILFWLRKFSSTGGIQILASRLLVALQERGHEFIVITSRTDPEQTDLAEYRGIPVHYLPFQDVWTYRDIERAVEVKRRVEEIKHNFSPVLLHVFAVGRGDFFHLTTAGLHALPLLVTLHGEHLCSDTAFGRLATQTVRASNWTTCVSQSVLAQTRLRVPEVTSRSSVVYNGYEMPSCVPDLPPRPPVLLCLGRLVREKGFDVALKAFASVSTRFPRMRLLIAGHGPEHYELRQQAAQLGIKDSVDFIGSVAPDHVPKLLNSVTAVLMPSRYEPFGLVALEAASVGRPIVASRIGGLSEIVIDRQTGILVEPENSAQISEAIVFLVNHPEKAIQLGRAARQRVQAVFPWDRCVDSYDALYQRLGSIGMQGNLSRGSSNNRL
jgi:glycogen(starch) synthase